jgi:tRNA(fMet)-specific endonuclease VapC
MRYLLDTDHVSLIQRKHPQLIARIAATPPKDLAVSVITLDEQLQGRLAIIRRAATPTAASRGYDRLLETMDYFRDMLVVPFDPPAVAQFEELRRQGVRIGTQDLRIAAIALRHQITVLTRNTLDFAQVPGLTSEDWSQP